jgi:hypothetical protein
MPGRQGRFIAHTSRCDNAKATLEMKNKSKPLMLHSGRTPIAKRQASSLPMTGQITDSHSKVAPDRSVNNSSARDCPGESHWKPAQTGGGRREAGDAGRRK